MKFMELFDSRDKKRRLSHIRNLVALSFADGNADECEAELVGKIGVRAGLDRTEIERIMTRPNSIQFYPPDNARDRIEQLYDMVLVMMVDGEIHENEILFCKAVALKLGFRHEIIDAIVEKVIECIAAGIIADVAVERLMRDLDAA